MNWLNKLERKFGRYAIPNLMYYMLGLNVVGFILALVSPEFYYTKFGLSVSAVLHGEVWRLFTFILDPPTTSPFFFFFYLMFLYWVGSALESIWGSFRFNLYYFSGIIFHILAAFIVYFTLHVDLALNLGWLELTLILAGGTEFPDYTIYLMGILPLKFKWLAAFDAIGLGMTILSGLSQLIALAGGKYASVYAIGNAVAALISVLNFLIYYFNSKNFKAYSPQNVKRRSDFRKKVEKGRKESSESMRARGHAVHRCAICGKTELDDEDLEFRFCSKCEGTYEYCMEHLYTHKHVTGK